MLWLELESLRAKQTGSGPGWHPRYRGQGHLPHGYHVHLAMAVYAIEAPAPDFGGTVRAGVDVRAVLELAFTKPIS